MKILTPKRAKKITGMAANELAKYLKRDGLRTIVLGISGGLDSAVMAAIGLDAIDQLKKEGYDCDYLYTFIDIESNPDDLRKARVLANELGFVLIEKDQTGWYQHYPNRIIGPQTHAERVHNANIKCRLRMIFLYSQAGDSKGIVLDTDDLSEHFMGFWTLHGDVGDVKVIQLLTKEEVRDLGEYLGITKLILDSAPGDGLGVTATNKASDQLGLDYLKIDYVMSRLIQKGFDINGAMSQLETESFLALFDQIADEISEPVEKILHVVRQSLRTSSKRKYGENVAVLLPKRTDLGLPNPGTDTFNRIYLKAITKIR